LNIGGGRIVYQDYTRISLAVEDGSLAQNAVLLQAMQKAKNAKLHLIGLLSDGGVHSHITHLFALLEMAAKRGLKDVNIHAVLDGRDVPPRSALTYIQELEENITRTGTGRVATVSGRYYTMDRDKRWERVEKAYRCLTDGIGLFAGSAREAVDKGYSRGENDEFLQPTLVDKDGLIQDNDSIIFFNFRPDRAREMTRAFVDRDFSGFSTKPIKVHYTCMTQYDATLDVPIAFPAQNLEDTLGQVISRAGLQQLRIAETEKYAHVTYFFNGGRETPNPGEDRCLIPSPRVATYDLQPEMSALLVRDEVISRIEQDIYHLMVINFANPDMVGHTGIFDAAVAAVEVVDGCVGAVVDKILEKGGAALLTADHGNAEKMRDEKSGQPHTAHTTNPIPFSLIMDGGEGCDGRKRIELREDGILADIAPTALKLLHIDLPVAMTGRSLIK
ncbi:2,3-bisphosphoglycerate-independent phosphoglycerate mutase, partial [bacterium]|nr:2,3-bisphosphoglycerate-independent phosphoglycerate mutase [bacterium]